LAIPITLATGFYQNLGCTTVQGVIVENVMYVIFVNVPTSPSFPDMKSHYFAKLGASGKKCTILHQSAAYQMGYKLCVLGGPKL